MVAAASVPTKATEKAARPLSASRPARRRGLYTRVTVVNSTPPFSRGTLTSELGSRNIA